VLQFLAALNVADEHRARLRLHTSL
jgi:hypothetical protein